jgi:hypothetical protein
MFATAAFWMSAWLHENEFLRQCHESHHFCSFHETGVGEAEAKHKTASQRRSRESLVVVPHEDVEYVHKRVRDRELL